MYSIQYLRALHIWVFTCYLEVVPQTEDRTLAKVIASSNQCTFILDSVANEDLYNCISLGGYNKNFSIYLFIYLFLSLSSLAV